MLDIRDIKTRDYDTLADSLRDILKINGKTNPLESLSMLTDMIYLIQNRPVIFFDKEIEGWVFTNCYDDDIVSQEYFGQENFVIVEQDLNLALARGIHYSYHKKVKE